MKAGKRLSTSISNIDTLGRQDIQKSAIKIDRSMVKSNIQNTGLKRETSQSHIAKDSLNSSKNARTLIQRLTKLNFSTPSKFQEKMGTHQVMTPSSSIKNDNMFVSTLVRQTKPNSSNIEVMQKINSLQNVLFEKNIAANTRQTSISSKMGLGNSSNDHDSKKCIANHALYKQLRNLGKPIFETPEKSTRKLEIDLNNLLNHKLDVRTIGNDSRNVSMVGSGTLGDDYGQASLKTFWKTTKEGDNSRDGIVDQATEKKFPHNDAIFKIKTYLTGTND